MRTTDVCVVGGGPAGIGAALAASERGASVVLVDEHERPGGQYYSSLPAKDEGPVRALRDRLRAQGVDVLTGAVAWGVFEGRNVMVASDGSSTAVRAGAIVLATGAYDRPVPFPGWTLPGVMSAGGAQTLVKAMGALPGRRVLLAGAGPFLLPVAKVLVEGGATVVLAEATGTGQWLRLGVASIRQPARMREAVGYARSLARRIERLPGHKVVRALGSEKVEGAVVARVDGDWRSLPGTERTLEIDAIAVGYGFLPCTDLAEQMGCELRFDADAQAWFVATDHNLETSIPGVFAAGELTGIGGNEVSFWEGSAAGARAAGDHAAAADALARLSGRRRFAAVMNRTFAPRGGLWEGLKPSVTVCRCEEVTAGEIRERVANGCTSVKAVKDWTRAGMGLCQGRICAAAVAGLVAEGTGTTLDSVERGSIRPPVRPVPIDVLAAGEVP